MTETIPPALIIQELSNSKEGAVQLELAVQRVIISRQEELLDEKTQEIERLLQESGANPDEP
jgi:predicted GIY-YIG superfamily endonuclease